MRQAEVSVHGIPAGVLETTNNQSFQFTYYEGYSGEAVSLTMPVQSEPYTYETFPPFFDGLLPEGLMLEGLLRQLKLDKTDYFSQLSAVGSDLVGAVTVREIL